MRNIIVVLSIVFFSLSAIVTIKSLRILVRNDDYQKYQQDMQSVESLLIKEQYIKEELTAIKKKYKEIVSEIQTNRKKIKLKHKINGDQEGKQYSKNIETSSMTNKLEQEIERESGWLEEKEDKNINISNKSDNLSVVNEQKANQKIYTLQTQKKNGTKIQAKSFNTITPIEPSQSYGLTNNNQSEKYNNVPVSNNFKLLGVVITNNERSAIIEDSNSKQSSLYNLNDKVGGFIVSDILENTVILNKKNNMVKIQLWEGKESRDIKREKSQSKRRGRIIRKRQLSRKLRRISD